MWATTSPNNPNSGIASLRLPVYKPRFDAQITSTVPPRAEEGGGGGASGSGGGGGGAEEAVEVIELTKFDTKATGTTAVTVLRAPVMSGPDTTDDTAATNEKETDEYQKNWLDDKEEMRRQLDGFQKINRFFSYPTYLWSARLRFAYFFFLTVALVFVCMLAFVFNIFFSVLLPEAKDQSGWGYRAGFMLPFAPIVLVGGSWFCDQLLELMTDAMSPNIMLTFRLRLATVIHVFRNFEACSRPESPNDEYDGPEMDVYTMVIVDIFTPILMEAFPLTGFFIGAVAYQTMGDAMGGYFAWGLLIACLYGIVAVVCKALVHRFNRFAVAHKFFQRSTPMLVRSWNIPQFNAPRVLNLGRYLRRQRYWKTEYKEPKFGVLSRAWNRYREKVPWIIRMAIDLGAFVMVSLLTAYGYLEFGAGWFLLCVLMLLIGYKLMERFPELLSQAFSGFLVFFTIFGGLLFIFALANLEPSSALTVVPPASPVASPPLIESSSDLETKYLVCQKSWKGLTVLDLAVMSVLAYAQNDDARITQMTAAFQNTSLDDWQIVATQEPGHVIHYFETYFEQANVTVVAVRGTSTALEIYQDAYIYAGISIFEFINTFAPITSIIPTYVVQGILYYIALPGLAAGPAHESVINHTKKLVREGKNVVVTGHSLGGAVAGVVAAAVNVPAVTFSPPGLYYNARRLGITTERLRKNVVSIVPEKDVVPKVDREIGSVQFIECLASAPACHSIDRTTCKLRQRCGDVRDRQWDDYCKPFDT